MTDFSAVEDALCSHAAIILHEQLNSLWITLFFTSYIIPNKHI